VEKDSDMRIIFAQILAAFLLFVFSLANAKPLHLVKDAELSSLLAFQITLAEKQRALRGGSDTVRIIIAPYALGECWGTIKSCPDLRLFISIIPDDLYEKSRLYRLPNSKGWLFGSWKEIEKGSVIEFTLQTSLPDANIEVKERTSFRPIQYNIRIGEDGANVETK
jgi:hypothetical protein